jgi:hypothetical protein
MLTAPASRLTALFSPTRGNHYHLPGGTGDTINVFTQSVAIYVLAINKGYRHADVIGKKIDDLSHGRGKFVNQPNSGGFLFRIRQDLPIYRFVIKKGDEGIPEKIEVYTETGKRPVQILSISDGEEECTTPMDGESMQSADYNYDGNADIAFSCDCGVTVHETFMVWLFSPIRACISAGSAQNA